jgi:hypothetical protein
MRPKTKKGRIKVFNLTDEEINLTEQLTRAGEFPSQSEFIGWLIRNYAISKDPIKELEIIKQDKKRLQKSTKELEEKEAEVLERMKAYKKSQEEREELKKSAIEIIQRKIMQGCNRFEIEDVARYWSFRLNIEIDELIYKAGIGINRQNRKVS